MAHREDELIIEVAPPAPTRGAAADRPEITMGPDVAAWIDLYARTDTTRELAGVLLGDVAASRGRATVRVQAAIEARFTRSDAASITFTHETWEDINAVRERRYPRMRIVGWFHTHPGLGVFLSRWDLFIHEHFFGEPWQVAYVVDPLARSSGFFRWEDGEVRSAGETVVPPRSARQARFGGAGPSLLRRCLPVVAGFAAGAASTALIFSLRQPLNAPQASAPARLAAMAPAKTRPDTTATYTVRRGDCLWRIAQRRYGDGRLAYALARANGLGNPNHLPAGIMLNLPEPALLAGAHPGAAKEAPR